MLERKGSQKRNMTEKGARGHNNVQRIKTIKQNARTLEDELSGRGAQLEVG